MNMPALIMVVLATLAAAAPPRAVRAVGDLRLEVATDRAAYRVGESVTVTLRVTSTATTPVVVTTGGQQYDVVVRQRGALVWQWSHDKAFVQVIQEISLAPGQGLTYRVVWDQRDLQGRRIDPGTYEISSVFLGSQGPVPSPSDVGPLRVAIGR